MLVFNQIKPDLLNSSCLALGVFDGVHLGHEKVILNAVKKSQNLDALSAVVTFSKHPRKTPVKLITTLDERLKLFEELGVQAAIVLDFTEEIHNMTAEDYIKKFLCEGLNARSITVGYNHHFGAEKKGNTKLLEKYSSECNYELTVIPPVALEGRAVSSSAIRNFISKGDVVSASKFLGRPFSVRGKVIPGQKRGALLGFPTANLSIPDNIIIPEAGVYSGMVYIQEKSYQAVINVGKRPTFGDLKENLIEVHILNFSGDLYNQAIEVSFLKKLREEKKFASTDELKEQIILDCREATFYQLNSTSNCNI